MLKSLVKSIKVKFGSKRGLLAAVYYRLLTMLGVYRCYQRIDWSQVKRVIVVCHGNICRSPLGDVYVCSQGIVAFSYGVGCTDNHPADPRAIAFAAQSDLDLSAHKTQNMQHYQAVQGDLVVVMEPVHLLGIAPYIATDAQVTLAGLWLPNASAYIHDPFNTNPLFFERCENTVLVAMQNITNKIKTVCSE